MLTSHTNPDSVREEHEARRNWESSQRRHGLLTAAVIVLTAGITSLAWYACPILKNHDSSLAKLAGIEPVVGALNGEMKSAESKLSDLSTSHADLRQQMDKLGRDMRAHLESARKQTSDATGAMLRRVESEIDLQVSGLRTRVASLESSRESDQLLIAGLQRELTQVQGQLSRQSEDLAATRRQMEGNSATTDQQISSLQDSELHNRNDVDRITSNLAVDRVSFEVPKGHSRELAPGISMGLTGTDVPFNRVNGWMWFRPDRRTIWLRGQSVQEPVVFYGLEDGNKRELVITHVTRNSVVGYLILPQAATTSPSAAATSD
jgi:predicted  nucleic acid-binding Zn-ribbon protein